MAQRPGRPRALTLEQIINATIADGMTTFSMPSVADRLGVAHSGLYRYVQNREALLVAVLDKISNEASWPAPDQPWREQLAALGESLWTICNAYPGYAIAAPSTEHVSPGFVAGLTPTVETLHRQGFDIFTATAATEFVATLVVNSSMLADRMRKLQGADGVPEHTIPGFADPELWAGRAWYQRHLDVHLDGLEVLWNRERSQRARIDQA